MKTFIQFLQEREKRSNLYGMGTGNTLGKSVSVKPARGFKPTFNGLNVVKSFNVATIKQ